MQLVITGTVLMKVLFYSNTGSYWAKGLAYRVPADIKLMKDLGVNSYRFSVEWSRIQPTGPDSWDQLAMDHYSNEIDALIKVTFF